MYYVYIIDFRLGGSGGKLAISNLETTNVWTFYKCFRKHLVRHFAKPMLAVVALFLVSIIFKQLM